MAATLTEPTVLAAAKDTLYPTLDTNAEQYAVTLVNPSGVRTAFGSDFRDQTNNTALNASTTLDPTDAVDAVAYATKQETPVAATELELNRRDIFERF